MSTECYFLTFLLDNDNLRKNDMLFYRKLSKSCKWSLATLQIADVVDVDDVAEDNKNKTTALPIYLKKW